MDYPNLYFVAKSMHLVGAFSWMAGLFYLVRIMVYHAESQLKSEPERSSWGAQYGLMEQKAFNVIIKPATVITWAFGVIMLFVQPLWLQEAWLQAKLVFLLLLTGYTWYCSRHIKLLETGAAGYTHIYYRAMNEIPTILMVGIIFLAVFKSGINWVYLSTGIALFTGLIFYAVRKVNRKRK
jgi:putative membrane protein